MSDNQVSFATLGNAVGFVVQISGSVRVQSIDGQERIVNVGDPIFYGETVIAIGNGSATIEFVDGNQIVVANEAVVEITDEVFSFGDAQELVADSSVDFDELQQAILEGQDPTLIQDAPAAGNDGTDDGDSDRVDVSINRSGQEALPSYGYDTDNSRDVDTGGSAYYGRETAPDPFAFATSSTTNNTSASSSASTTPLTINLDIDPITTDSIVNAAEAADNVTVTGSVTGDAFTSGTVQLTVNGTVYTGTVVNGGFSISVAGSDLANDADAIVDGSVQVSNSAGQTGQASSSQSYAVDVTATAGTVTVDDITSDDVINASEAAGTVTVTGTATGGDIAEGDTVTLEINGNIYTTTVAAGGTWSVDVAGTDLAADTAFDVSVESDDASGNSVVSNGSSTHTVDTTASAGIDIDTITSDSILNASETTNGNIVTVSGWVSGDAKAGDTVQIVLDDAVIAETVVSSQTDSLGRLTYSVGVLGSVLASTSSANPYITAKVSGTDVAGNSFSVTSTEIYKVDTWADIEVFAQDGNGDLTVNYDEQGSLLIGGFTETASTVTALTISDSAGNSISIPLADISYTDSDGWGYFEANVDVTGLLDGVLTVNASVSDAVGNVAYAAPSTIQKDTVADQGTVTVDNITSDDMISLDESQQVLPVTGTAIGGDIAEGDTLTLEVNGTKYTTLVGVDGHWSVDVQGSDLLADTEISVVVNSSDSVGNTVKSFGYSTHSVVAPVVSIAADQTNVTEGGTAGFTVSIDQVADEDVVVSFTYSTTDADGNDYTGVASVTIQAGQTSADLDIATIDDGIYEGAESFTVSIDSVSGADATVSSDNGSASTTIVDNESAPVVSIAADQTNVTEGGTAGFTVSIDQVADEDVVVSFTYSTTDADGNDYTGVASVTIQAGQTSADLDIATIDDGIYEGAESFTVSIDSVSGADATVSSDNGSASTTIVDNESAPVVSIAADQTNVTEGGTAGFTVSIDQVADEDVVVSFTYSTTDADGNDYTGVASVTIQAGQTSADLDIATIDDGIYEGAESFTVSIDSVSGADATVSSDNGSASTTIVDNESAPVVSIAADQTNVTEGGTAGFTVSIDQVADEDVVVSFTYSTTDADGNDYTGVASVTIQAGQTSADLDIATIDDGIYEGAESFTVSIDSVSGADATVSSDNGSASTTIVDNESAPVVSIAADQTNVTEGGTAGFTVSIDQVADEDVVVSFTYSTTDADGNDYTGVASVTIQAGQTSADLDIATIDDGIYEGAESFTVSIDSVSGADATVSSDNGSASTTIVDNESAPVVSIAADQTNVTEGGTAGFTVSIDQVADEDVVVSFTYSTTDADGNDYTGVASVTIQAGQTSADLDIATIDDGIYEGAESFTVSIDSVSGADATVSSDNGSASTTIVDNESAPVVSIAADQTNVTEGGTAGFTVSIDQVADEDVVVSFTYSTTDADGNDYTGVASVTIQAGQTSADLDIATIDDGIYEGAESFTVSIDSVSGADATVSSDNGSASTTIVDNESAPVVSIAADQTNVTEGGTAGFTVSIDQVADEDVVVSFTYSTTDADGNDYTGVASVTIQAGQTSADLDIATIDDGIYEGAESFTVSIDSVSGADATVSSDNGSASTTIVDNESAPVVSIAADQTNVTEGGTAGFTVSIDQVADEDVVVSFTYSTTDADGNDYTGVASVTIQAGQTSADLDIATIDDGIYEGAESFTVSIDSVSGADATVSSDNGSASTTIVDNESAPVVSIAADQTNVTEGGTAGFTVSIDQVADEDVVVSFTYSTTDADGNDYTGVASVTIQAGQTSADLDIATIDDGIYEGAESFTVSIDSVSGADATVSSDNGSASTTIVDNESAPVVSIAADQTNVTEGGTAGFTVSIDQVADEDVVVSFTYSTTDADGNDYTGVASVTIQAGQTSADLDIATIDDGIYEGAESFTVSIDSVSGADATVSSDNGSASTTIVDNESAPVVSIAADQTNVTEGGTAGFTVSIDQVADEDVVVSFTYSTTDADGNDYTGVASVTIQAGQTSADLDIATIDDGIYEGAESFTVSIDSVSGADATVSSDNGSASTTIVDNESAPVVSIAADQTNVTEGGTAGFTVSIDQVADEDVVVSFTYSTTDADGNDYTGVASVTIQAGQTSADLDIATIDDGIYEGAESFTVSIDSVSGADATVSSDNGSASTTIVDNESAPVVSIAADQTNVTEGGTAGFTVSIDQVADEDVVVSFTYSTTDADGNDYTGVASVTIQAGQTSADLDIATIDDGIYEGAESFTVSIDSVSGADATVSSDNGSASTTIVDNESAPVVSIAADQTNVTEGGTAGFTVSIDQVADEDVVVSFTYSTTDADGNDYTGVASVTIQAGQTSADLDIATIDDGIYEGAESFTVSIDSVSGADATVSSDNGSASTTIVDNESAPVVSIAADQTNVTEGGTAGFTVSIDQVADEDVVVSFTYSTTDADGNDYTGVASVTIQAGQTSADLDIATIDDGIYEGAESFTVSIDSVSGADATVSSDNGSASTTIVDNESAPVVSIAADQTNVTEGGTAGFTVSIDQVADEDVVVSFTYSTTDADGNDYTGVASVTIQAGQTSADLDIATIDDGIYEGAESFTVSIDSVSGADATVSSDNGSASTTIVDNESAPVVSIAADQTNVTEGGTAGFTVSIDQVADEDVVVSFTYSTTDADGNDYTGVASVTIQAGQTSADLDIATIDDGIYEGAESFTVSIDSVSGADATVSSDNGSASTTIVDNESAPVVSIAADQTNVTEGGTAGFTVSIDQVADEDVVVSFTYSTTDADGNDYTGVASVTIQAGQTSADLDIATIDDGIYEGAESFTVSIDSVSGADATVSSDNGSASTTIVDNESAPVVSIAADQTNVTEGGTAGFTVSIDQVADEDVVVSFTYSTTDADGNDYTGVASVTIQAGQTSADLDIATIDDGIYEGAESFTVSIDSVSGADATVSSDNGSASTTIVDNESAPVVSIAADQTNVTEGGTAGFTVSIDQVADEDVVVSFTYSTTDADGNDYTGVASVTIQAGQTSADLDIATIDDGIYEGAESFTVSIDSVSGADATVSSDNGSASTTIVDNESAPVVSIAADQTNVTEGGTAGFTVSIDQVADEDVVVSFTYSTTDADGNDYTGVASVTIQAGQTSADLDIATIDDGIYEGAESFTVSIDSVSGADATVSSDNGSASTTIVDNESAPVVSIAADQTNVTEGGTAGFTVSIDQVADEDVVVSFTYSTTDADGNDYTGVASVTIQAGQTSADLDIATIDDGIYEGAESFTVSIDSVSGADATVSSDNGSASTTIVDNESAPVVSIAADQTNVTEGGTAGFTVSIDQVADEDVVVSFTYSTTDADGNDYTGVASVTIQAGQTSADLDIATIDDGIYEGAESFTVSIDSVSGADATVSSDNGSASTTIVDNESAPVVSSISQNVSAEEGDDLAFDVTLSNTADTAQTFAFSLTDGTTDSSDYGDVTFSDGVTLNDDGTITVPAGVESFTVTVAGAEDTVLESDETFTLSVGGVESTGTITNDDIYVNIDIDPITSDSTVNASEASGTVVITGVVTSGDIIASGEVTLVIGGESYTGAVDVSNGTFSITVDGSSLVQDSDRIVVANVTVTNSEGHVGTSQSTEAYFVDTSARGSIQVNSITSDDIVNIEESTSSIIVSGRVGFDAAAGDTVTLVIGDTTYTTTVMANKTWAVSVAGEDLAQNTTFTAKVTGEDSAGNPFTATTTSIHQVDLSIGSPTLTFESTGEDEVYNAAEVAAGEADTITATISVDGSEVGDILTYSVNGAVSTHVLTQAEIANGYVIEVAPGAEVKATLSDSAGNMSDEVSATVAIADVSIGTPVISFQSTGDDDIYNAAEVAEGEVGTITATISLGGSEVGDTLTFIVNGVESIHTLTQDDINNGYTIEVPPGAEVKATLSDAAGNTSTQASEIAAEADLSVSGLTSDITDATNSGSNDDTITNDATPDITGVTEAGATVTITYTDANGTSRTATGTADGDGKYTIAIDNALAEGSNTLSIKAVDVAGNETTTTQNVTVDTSVSGLTSDITDATNSGSNDDTITNDATPDITGVTEAGATVTITYTDANGTSRTATGTADGDGKYTIAIDNALAEGSNTLSIKAVDVAGNETTTTQNVTVDLAAEVQDEQVSMLEDGSPITIDILDNDESGASLVEDSFSYDESLGTVTLNEDGTITFTPKANVSGDIEIQYTVQDAAGNTSTATATVTVTAVADAPVIATSSDDSSSAQGISYSFWTGVDSSTYGGNGGTPEQLAALVDSYSSVPPVGSGVVQSIPNLDNIATGTLAVATTYVYLEAGSNYSFTGSADDTFYVKVGGDVIAEAQWDNGNSGVESQVLTVSESGYYPVEIAYHNEDGNGYVNLGIKIDGGDSQEFGTSTLSMYPTSVIPGVGEAVYEDDGVTVDHYLMLNAGYEDQAVQLESFTINLADTDGSESLSTVISGAPAGTVITIGDDEFTFGADGTVDVGGITDFTDMTLETPEDYSGEFTLTFTATATEASNSDTAVSTKSIDVTVYEVNDAPSISIGAGDTASITVSEEGLANANADTDGSTDTTDAVTASGTLTVSDDGTNADIKMSFVAPADGLYESNGVDIKWSIVDGQLVGKAGDETIVTITVSDVVNGQVTYQATLTGPIDHSDSSTEDTLTIDFGVVATDDGDLASATQTVSLVVEDDSPESTTTTDTIELVKESSAASSFTVSSIAGGFVNPSFSSGENRTQQQNTDSDSYKDKLSWDDGSGCDPTSIALTDTSSVASTDMGSNIVIGTFTHVNTPVSTSYKSLDSTNLEYKVTVNINGVATLVTLTAQVVVDETNNSNNDSSDYIQLSNLSSTTVTVDGVDYVVSLSGFLDSNGNVITQFSTAEDATSQYSVVANVSTSSGSVPESDYGTITGNVSLNVDVGADGGSVVAETITTDKGTLVVKADGSYEFTPSDSFAGSISQGSSGEAVFTYHVKDADGDTVENTLTLTVNDANDAPVATDDVLTTYTGLKGEYFGFNEQIDDLVDFKSLIAGKTADATFIGQNINYQYGTGDVGKDSNLQNFLGSDASSLSTDPGNTSDGGIRLTGYIYLEAGTYNFKVYADDGYQITIDGNAVATVTNNQSPNGTVHNAFTVEADGYYSIEMLWWDQGGDYVFQPTLSSDGGNTYSVLDSSSLTTNPTGSQSVTTTDGQSIVIDPSVLLSNDTDADGDTLSVTSVDNVQHGYAYINSAGKIIFVPEAGYTGSASFDYTITDGNGAYDSATATLEVDGDMSGQASVDVTITKVGSGDLQDPTAGVSFDSSVLTKHYDHDYNSWFNFQNKQYQVIVDDDVDGASMQTGNGDDIVTVGDDVKNSGHIDTGEGNDVVIIGDDITSSSSVHLGNGDNIAKVVDDVDGHIESGSGNDTVYIKGNLNGTSDLGDGNDVAVIVGRLDGYISGGSGTDSIWLQSYSYNDWVNNKDNIKYDVANFENIKFKDGAVIGDSNAFATSFTYSVSVDINDLASGEDVISVTISGVPDGAKLQQDGTDLTVNSDGTYTVSVTSGSTTIDNLTVVSETDSDIAEFELIATVTTDGDNTGIVGSSDEEDTVGTGGDDYLVGDSDEDSLLGGAGDDVLFGGDDESVDVLVGGEGSDIFILDNDTNLGNGFTQDVLMDFNASEDAIDISDLLDLPSETNSEDIDAVQAFLEANVTISEDDEGVKHLSIGEGDEKQDVATFGSDSNLDTDNSGSVGSGDSLTVIYNNQEYNINLDG